MSKFNKVVTQVAHLFFATLMVMVHTYHEMIATPTNFWGDLIWSCLIAYWIYGTTIQSLKYELNNP